MRAARRPAPTPAPTGPASGSGSTAATRTTRPGPFLPYVYAPWLLPLFAPWALLPWDVAWFVWRGATILLLFWTIHWAYRQRPVATAVALSLLAFPIAANLDTGNLTLILAFMLWAAQFAGPRLAGLLWALATWAKWVPAPAWLILRPRGRAWGLVWLGLAMLLSLATLPVTIVQLETLFGFGGRPIRLDYLVLLWAAIPWLWRHPDPLWWLHPREWPAGSARLSTRLAATPRGAGRLGGAVAARSGGRGRVRRRARCRSRVRQLPRVPGVKEPPAERIATGDRRTPPDPRSLVARPPARRRVARLDPDRRRRPAGPPAAAPRPRGRRVRGRRGVRRHGRAAPDRCAACRTC